jgi:hypothetical protein
MRPPDDSHACGHAGAILKVAYSDACAPAGYATASDDKTAQNMDAVTGAPVDLLHHETGELRASSLMTNTG